MITLSTLLDLGHTCGIECGTVRRRSLEVKDNVFGLARLGAVLALIAPLTLGVTCAAWAAPGGYGPAPPSNGAPGGFTTVVTSKVIGPGGGSVVATVNGKTVTITVPPGDFPSPEDLVVTNPDLNAVQGALSSLGFGGFNVVGGAGVAILDMSGNKVTRSFPNPIQVTISGSGLGVGGEKVLALTGPSSATTMSSSLGSSSVTVSITADPNLVVINPASSSAASGAVPGATSLKTGKPFNGETYLAVVLGALAVAVIGVGNVRRRRFRVRRSL